MQINNRINQPKSPAFSSRATIGKEILTGKISKIAESIEFNKMNMSFPVLLVAMFGGVLTPRLIQAQDKYDREEILRRDAISISTIAVGAPILSKMFSKFSEKKSGFALTHKDDFASKNTLQKVYDYIRPIKGVKVLSSSELISKYSNIKNYKNGAAGFCEFVDSEGGNLKKIFDFNDETKKIVSQLFDRKEDYAKADNGKIIKTVKKAMAETPEKLDALYKHFEKADNVFVKKAKSMNSKFGFLSMILIVPLCLGIILPKINEKITKRKIAENKNLEKNTKNSEHHKIYQNPYFMASAVKDKTVFNRFNKSD